MRTYLSVSVAMAAALALSGCSGAGGTTDEQAGGAQSEKERPILADVDGDGLGDVIGSGPLGDGAKVLRSDGEKLVSTDPGGWGEWTETAGTVTCDFDADGKLDSAQLGSAGYVVYYQSGEKSKPVGLASGDPAWQVSQAFCGDFDGDDLVDVAFTAGNLKQRMKVRAYVVRQASSGTWEKPQQWIEMSLDKNTRSVEFQAGDWDGDSRTDLMLETVLDPLKEKPDAEGATRVMTGVPAMSTGTTFAEGAVLKLTDVMLGAGDRGTTFGDLNGMQSAPVDVNGDGADELVKVGLHGWHDTYSLADESWEIVQASRSDFKDYGLSTRAASDVNGDHFGDVVAMNREGKVVVFLGGEEGLADGVEWPQLVKQESIEDECAYGSSSPVSPIC